MTNHHRITYAVINGRDPLVPEADETEGQFLQRAHDTAKLAGCDGFAFTIWCPIDEVLADA